MPAPSRLSALLLTLSLTLLGVSAAEAQPADAVWVAESDGALKVRAVDGSPLAEIIELDQVRAVAVDLVQEHVWLLSEGDLYLYDFAGARRARVPLGAPRSVHAAIIGRAGSRDAWVAVGGLLWTVDDGQAAGGPVDLGAEVRALAHDPFADVVWIATARTLERLPAGSAVPEVVTSFHPRDRAADMALDPVAGRIWVALPQEVRIYDLDGSELRRIPAAGVEHLAAGRGEAWAATKRELARYAADGTRLASARPFAGRGTIVDVVSTWNRDAWAADANRLAQVTPAGEVAQVLGFHPPSKIWQLGHGDDVFPPTVEILEPTVGLCTADPWTPIRLAWSDVGSGVDPVATVAEIDGVPVAVSWDASLEGATGVPVDSLADGVHQLRVTVSDRAGNVSQPAETSWTVDTVPPGFSELSPADGYVTDQPEVTLSGRVDEAAEVRLAFAGASQTRSAGADGAFSFAPITLEEGVNVVRLEAEDCAGNVGLVEIEVTFEVEQDDDSIPPDPATVAPPNDETVATDIASSTAFLYTGPNPIQRGVAPGTIDPLRVAVVRGRVLDTAGEPLAGVRVSIHDRPELGWTLSREDGEYDLAVNGGGILVLSFESDEHLEVQRRVRTPWRDYLTVDDVVMTILDPEVTIVQAGASETQVARGTMIEDADGRRQATMIFPPGLQAEMILPDGTRKPLSSLSVRATEYTVGETGTAAMPGKLPPSSGYTYAVELSVDEALSAGARSVEFDRPVAFYVENFLDFPVGEDVPTGWYDRQKSAWIPSDDGRIVEILAVEAGHAVLDVDGDGMNDSASELSALGIEDTELAQLAGIYEPGTSLWRSPISHFTPWDCNWPYGPPDDAEPPPDVDDEPDSKDDPDDPDEPEKDNNDPAEDKDDPDCVEGSVIECQNQTLHKRIDLPGVPFDIHYSSARVPGRSVQRIVEVKVSEGEIPPILQRIELTIEVAGSIHRKSFAPAPDITYSYVWDGRDRFGRMVRGEAKANIRLRYVYPGVYYQAGDWEQSFAQFGTRQVIGSGTRDETALDSTGSRDLFSGFPAGAGLAGWQVTPVHTYDTQGRRVLLGDGTILDNFSLGQEIDILAGQNRQPGEPEDGLPASEAKLNDPKGLFASLDGSLYIADWGSERILRVRQDSIIETVVGGGNLIGNGIPATEADIGSPRDVVVAEDGSIYFTSQNCVFNVEPEGLLYRNVCGLPFEGLDLDAEGNLIVAARSTVQKIDRDGRMTTLAGTGDWGSSGDGGPAIEATFRYAKDVSVGPDGSVYIADRSDNKVRKITPDGLVQTVAGTGWRGEGGDGVPGTSSSLYVPISVEASADGSLFIVQRAYRIRWLRSDGIITTVVGQPWAWGSEGDGGPALAATIHAPQDVAISQTGDLYLSDSMNSTVRVVRSGSLPGFDAKDLIIPSKDGSRLHIFDPIGRHLKTHLASTGGLLWEPRYDDAGRLIGIRDGNGNETSILRSDDGSASGIEGPFGSRIELETNSDGNLSAVVYPDGRRHRFEYGFGDLLTTSIDPAEGRTEYDYSANGRLVFTTDQAGATRTFDRFLVSDGFFVRITTPSTATTDHAVTYLKEGGEVRSTRSPDGTTTETIRELDGTTTVQHPDGSMLSTRTTGDPRFGLSAPILEEATLETPRGLRVTARSRREVVTGSTQFDLESQVDRLEINGRIFTTEFDASSNTIKSISAEGRQARILVDDLGRTTKVESPLTKPLAIEYRPTGAVGSMTTGEGTGARTTMFGYDDRERLTDVTDPLSRTISFTYDEVDRVTETTLADGESVAFEYDPNGNVTSVTPPGRPAHAFTYTPTNLPETYVLPDAGAGPATESRSYDLDRRLVAIERADGRSLGFSYDADRHRLSAIDSPRGITTLDYDDPTGHLTSITEPDGESLAFDWDGPLLTSATWSGTIAGSVAWTYDSDFRPRTVALNGTDAITYGYDQDSLVTTAGALAITREPDTGRESTTSLGNVTTSRTYTSFGEPDTLVVEYAGNVLYSEDLDYDQRGWITEIARIQSGGAHDWSFGYDLRGRLETVMIDGSVVSTYGYDANSNRIAHDGQFGSVIPSDVTIDARDRLLRYGDLDFTYTEAGELLTKMQNGQTIAYDYDVFGSLRSVQLPNGTTIEYVTDGANRRIGKKINGILVQGFLYQDALNPIAELDGAGNVVSRFVYATRSNLPDYMVRDGKTYRIVADHLGSPRLVVDVDTGTIAQELRYDEFGRVTLDTNPGFQPFGFAGGLYDGRTGLVRFGARDYDPSVGRWTSKDPVGFNGGTTNLYHYVQGDPVNYRDPSGLERVEECSRPVEIPGAKQLGIPHKWLRTDEKEAGLGAIDGGVPGQGEYVYGDNIPYVTQSSINDHSGQGDAENATCVAKENVDVDCVNREMDIGKSMGTWAFGDNDCWAFTRNTLNKCNTLPAQPYEPFGPYDPDDPETIPFPF